MWESDLSSSVRSSNPAPAVALLLASGLLAGCVASDGRTARLDAGNGSGDVAIHLVVEDGALTDARAWWADEVPEDEPEGPPLAAWEAIVLKNDVRLDRVPLSGSTDRAELLWRSDAVDAVATPGDEFEVNVVNATGGAAVASFTVAIQD